MVAVGLGCGMCCWGDPSLFLCLLHVKVILSDVQLAWYSCCWLSSASQLCLHGVQCQEVHLVAVVPEAHG